MTTAAPIQPTPAHKAQTFSKLDSETVPVQSSIPRGRVTSELNFYAPPTDGSAPYNYVEDPPEGVPKSNIGTNTQNVGINDLRGIESRFSLDGNAFEALTVPPSAERDFTDDEHIKRMYYPEVEQLLLSALPGAHRVLLFDHTIRRANPNSPRAPVTRVHIDQTPSSAAQRVRFHLPDDADELLKGRYRIVNVWRPINGDVESFPLAVADSSTVLESDLVGIQHIYPDRTGETAGVKHNEEHKWYYWSGIGDNERLLLKCFDSDDRVGKWGRVPHTAFVDPRSGDTAKPRESIEVRALVFG